MRTRSIYSAFLVLVGIVVGSLLAKVTASVPALGWLSYALTFGLESPFVLNLSVVRLTFGLSVDLSISVILCVVISLVLGNYFYKS
ncbi:MAG: DUF4321 domain-containing protein [Ruminococcaceae bacterium]|nr:DUF4321 domain-containing protein [Oscillospiraceae bacterium]